MKETYTQSASQAIRYARQTAKSAGHSYIGTEHLLLGLIKSQGSTAASVLEQFHVEENAVLELMDRLIDGMGDTMAADAGMLTPRAGGILRNAAELSQALGMHRTGTEHILLAILQDVECVAARLLYTMQINLQEMYRRLLDICDAPDDWPRDLMKNVRSAGEDQYYITPVLDQFATDLTQKAREGKIDPIVGREEQTLRLLQILSRRTKNNPCLVGEPGVGKTAIVEGLAQKIAAGKVPDSLRDRRVMTLDMASMVAGSKYRGEFEERMKRVLNEVTASREILLFIDELHTIIGAGGAEGSLDASNIMKPFLSRGEVQVIGATTISEYRKYVEKDPALERRFQPVMVEEPTEEESLQILQGLKHIYEEHHGVVLTDEALEAAVKLSKRYVSDRYLPDKAIDVMDETCARKKLFFGSGAGKAAELRDLVRSVTDEMEEELSRGEMEHAKALGAQLRELTREAEKEEKKAERRLKRAGMAVTAQDIAQTIAGWTGIPAARVAQSEGARLLKLESELHKRVISQNEAVLAVSSAIKRGRAGLKSPRRPIGSFLFLGPTGVGKTELAKAIAQVVFGDEQSMIRVDMSEYMEKHSVSRLVGSPPGYVGYEEGGQLSEQVRRHPYSVILFDEIEKAHPDVFNILLQVLDEGHITDSQGRRVDFKNTILIMTSNAGAQSIMNPKRLGFGAGEDVKADYERMKSGVLEEVRRIFKPEFLNRIDDTIVFHALTRADIHDITDLLFKELAARSKDQAGVTLKAAKSAKDLIASKGYDEKYGARPLRRALQNLVEDPLSDEILSGRVKAGDTVRVKAADGKIGFEVK